MNTSMNEEMTMTKMTPRKQEGMMLKEALSILAERYEDNEDIVDRCERIANLYDIYDWELDELNKELKKLDKKYEAFCKKRMN